MPAFSPTTTKTYAVALTANVVATLNIPPGNTQARIVHAIATPTFVDFGTTVVAPSGGTPGGLPVYQAPASITLSIPQNGTLALLNATAGTVYVTFGTGDYGG